MKSTIKFLVLTMLLILAISAFASCTALEHNWAEATCTTPKTCTDCGITEGEALGHTEQTVAGTAATCCETGLTEGKICSVCNEVLVEQKVVLSLGHTEQILTGKAATCTESGITEGKVCSVCNEVIVAQEEIPALGHDVIIDESKDPTCTETGFAKGMHCSRCDLKVEQYEVPALGHDVIVDAAVAPTCTETGLTEGSHCSRCDHKVAQEIVPATGHNIVADAAVAPTCTATGLTAGEHCTKCDYKVAQTVLPAAGHNMVTDAAVAATCTSTGLTEGSHCTRCTHKVAQEVVPTIAHSWIVLENGSINCSVCGAAYALNGSGTEADPYTITDAIGLVFFRNSVNNGDAKYTDAYVVLAADIDLASVTNWTPIGIVDYDNKYAPVDTTKVFSGVFDGNGKTIYNLTMTKIMDNGADAEANLGLFGITGEGAVIKNLTITNVTITTDGRNVGALAGFAYMATIDNITVNGNIQIKGGNNVSGVCAMTRHHAMSATNITVKGNDGSYIVGNNIVGGIFAEIAPNGSEQTFSNLSVENVAIEGKGGVGGIVGLLTTGTIDTVSVKNVSIVANTLYNNNVMGRIRMGSVAGLMGGKYATIANATVENVTAKNLDGNAVVLPVIGANYTGSVGNATEAKVGDTYYATFAGAYDAAKAGDTIVLFKAIVVEAGKTLTLNKGVTITYTSNVPGEDMITNRGTLIVDGDTIIYANTDATASNVTVSTISCEPGSVLEVKSGVIKNDTVKADGSSIYSYVIDILTNGGLGDVTVTISGGEIISTNYMAIRQFNNGTACKNTLNVTGGYIYGAKRAIQVHMDNNAAYLTISGGKIEAGEGGYALCLFPKTSTNIAITGGEFIGIIYSGANGFVSGGTFNEELYSGYCVLGYTVKDNGNGTYTVEKDNTVLYISTLEELKALRDAVNSGENYFEGITVYLAADIDLAGENWVGIGSMSVDHGFMGNFDGNGFKIKNLTITNPALDSDGYVYAGFFSLTEGIDADNQNFIKNLVIENVTIETNGHIVSAAIAYSYYTALENITVCGDIAIKGGNYTAGALAYTRRLVDAKNITVSGNAGSYITGAQVVGGVISDIQTNGGLVANYSNFSASGLTVTGTKMVGGISGIICLQTLDGATVKNVTLVSGDSRVGIVAGSFGDVSTIKNIVTENVTGATAIIGSTYKNGAPVAAKIGDTYYSTLEAALAAANGETIVLVGNVALDAPIVIEKGTAVTIDLAGFVLSYESKIMGEAMITNRGQLTIKDSGETGEIFYNYVGANDASYGKGNYTISNCGTLVIDGGKIHIANLSGHAKYPVDNNSTTGDAILIVNGGHLYNYNTSAIRMFCNSTTYNNSVTINGGLIEGYCAIWVQNPGKNTVNGQLTINGGEIKSTAKAYVNGTSELKDVSSALYFTIAGEGGDWSKTSFVKLIGGIFNENVYLVEDAPSVIEIGSATFNGYFYIKRM